MSGGVPALGQRAHAAVAAVVASLGPGVGEVAPEQVLDGTDRALDAFDAPVILAEVPYDGAPGAVALVLTVAAARRLAAVTGAIDEEEAEAGGPLPTEPELGAVSALAEGLGPQAVAAAAETLSLDLAPGAPGVRVLGDGAQLAAALAPAPHAVVVPFSILGEPCALVVPAPGELPAPAGAAPAAEAPLGAHPLAPALQHVAVRVWAELGRTRMPAGQLVGLPSGAIVELDHDAEDAVDLYVDGQHYASGRLVVTDDESWGVRIERIHPGASATL